jgi:hypothetical protein
MSDADLLAQKRSDRAREDKLLAGVLASYWLREAAPLFWDLLILRIQEQPIADSRDIVPLRAVPF